MKKGKQILTKYVVEEVEDADASFSYEFDSQKDANKQFKKSLKKPGYGTTVVRMWFCYALEEKKVKR